MKSYMRDRVERSNNLRCIFRSSSISLPHVHNHYYYFIFRNDGLDFWLRDIKLDDVRGRFKETLCNFTIISHYGHCFLLLLLPSIDWSSLESQEEGTTSPTVKINELRLFAFFLCALRGFINIFEQNKNLQTSGERLNSA